LDELGGIDLKKAVWSERHLTYVPCALCPVCGEKISKESTQR
jgi:hypothetical protein